ncbi:radical SAM enzyme [Bimuria novae-zelandiae CBS 107.79]|uniref:Radical SAM enzyme n=1 Tax=Bimuria novae-zelandiae CBS 107.79 TaxID=1447943 RepID=A0A6A5VL43_9PLEO|nr:radical SAM enzyme [Bimuria novae-zelandiae CBS 107.79]
MPIIKTLAESPAAASVAGTALAAGAAWYLYKRLTDKVTIPKSVNYHYTRKCNAECGFCFHTELSSHHEKLPNAFTALRLLKEAGMEKVNFAGGEPFLYPKHLGKMCKFAKEELKLESVSIVSNGTKVTEKWLREYGVYVDILAVSCDSFIAATNEKIGRKDRGNGKAFDNMKQLFQVRDWCAELGIKFKLNTVVCKLNWEEDMVESLKALAPSRWKVFQVLVVAGENENDERLRNARNFTITDEEFKHFCDKHKSIPNFVPEDNAHMAASYLILDEYLRFLDAGVSKEKTSGSIVEIGVQRALKQINWDETKFVAKGGLYDWSKKSATEGCGGGVSGIDAKELEF